MLLQNLMEDKQLDFNRPLLSIRRASSGQTSESENKTGSCEPVSKKPPLPFYRSDIKSGPLRNPGTVPFQWEHRPGKPKDESKSDLQNIEQPRLVPKLPPGRTLNVKQQESGARVSLHAQARGIRLNSHSSSDRNVRKYESAKDIEEDAKSCSSEYFDDENEDDDDAYMDAIDRFSRSESFFLNCSISGVSALDGPELQPSSDLQTRDLMMGRFLPAAKAMASEKPPYPTRRLSAPQAQPRPIKQVMPMEKRYTVQRNPNNLRSLHYQQGEKWEESEEEDDSDRPYSKISGACGLLPQICLKSSFGLLSPVPGVRTQVQRAVSVRRLSSKYLDSRPCEIQNKPDNGAQYGQKPMMECQKMESHEDKVKLKPQLNQNACGTQKLDGSVLQSPCRGESLLEKVENFNASSDSLHANPCKNFAELLASDDNRWESCPESPVAEKTLYVDTVHMAKSPKRNTNTSDAKEQADSKGHPLEGWASLDCPGKDIEHLQMNEGRKDDSLIHGSIESKSPEVAENIRACPENEAPNKASNDESPRDNDRAIVPFLGSGVPGSTKEKIDLEKKSYDHHPQRPVPPPLPKAPSDSWLKRTLPAISSKSSSAWSSLVTDNHTKIQSFHIKVSDPKWKMMAKTSNTQDGLMHLSKEKLNPIPEA